MTSTQKTRILYINNSSYIGGAENSLQLLIHSFRKRGFEVHLLLPQPGELSKRLADAPIQIHYLDFQVSTNKTRLFFDSFRYSLKLSKLIRRLKIDLVHTNSLRSSLDSVMAARLAGVPIIGHIRDMRPLGARGRLLMNKLDRLIAVSEATRQYFIDEGVDAERIVRVYNGIDLSLFKPQDKAAEIRKQYNVPAGVPVIGIVGQLCERKGQIHFLNAAKAISADYPQVHFMLVGDDLVNDGAYRRGLEALTAELGISDRTHFIGFVSNVQEVLEAMDILVLASLQDPFPRVVLEGMAKQKPVIGTAVGGIVESIADQETGFLVPPASAEGLAEKNVGAAGGQLAAGKKWPKLAGSVLRPYSALSVILMKPARTTTQYWAPANEAWYRCPQSR